MLIKNYRIINRAVSVAALAVCFGMTTCVTSAGAASAEYTYDVLGRVTKIIHSDQSRVEYSYDAAGNRTQVVKLYTPPTTPGNGPSCTSGSGMFVYWAETEITFSPSLLGISSSAGGLTRFVAMSMGTINQNGSVTISGLQTYQSYTYHVTYTVSDMNGTACSGDFYVQSDNG